MLTLTIWASLLRGLFILVVTVAVLVTAFFLTLWWARRRSRLLGESIGRRIAASNTRYRT